MKNIYIEQSIWASDSNHSYGECIFCAEVIVQPEKFRTMVGRTQKINKLALFATQTQNIT